MKYLSVVILALGANSGLAAGFGPKFDCKVEIVGVNTQHTQNVFDQTISVSGLRANDKLPLEFSVPGVKGRGFLELDDVGLAGTSAKTVALSAVWENEPGSVRTSIGGQAAYEYADDSLSNISLMWVSGSFPTDLISIKSASARIAYECFVQKN